MKSSDWNGKCSCQCHWENRWESSNCGEWLQAGDVGEGSSGGLIVQTGHIYKMDLYAKKRATGSELIRGVLRPSGERSHVRGKRRVGHCRGLKLTGMYASVVLLRVRDEHAGMVPSMILQRENELLPATVTNTERKRDDRVGSTFGGL